MELMLKLLNTEPLYFFSVQLQIYWVPTIFKKTVLGSEDTMIKKWAILVWGHLHSFGERR